MGSTRSSSLTMQNHLRGRGGGFAPLPRVALVLLGALLAAGCGPDPPKEPPEQAPPVVTADIQAGIEAHVQREVAAGGGYFRLPFGDRELRLKLVRVHTEYLANLGPRRHFACVDLADVSGDVYDADFFLEGDPGEMVVTQTTVHKKNGVPYYTWQQKQDGTWHRVPVEGAPPRLLGIVHGTDRFELTYRVVLPAISGPARIWLPLASSDRFQDVEVLSMELPGAHRVLRDRDYGNRILYAELGPKDSGRALEIRYRVERREKASYEAPEEEARRYLGASLHVPVNDEFRRIAEEAVAGKAGGDLVRARALYDHVIDRMQYIRAGDGWGQGDAVRACRVGAGNCTDYHSLFISLARSIGIPARFAVGLPAPSSRDDGGIHGYHCYAEFYAEGKWWPVDTSEADKYSALSTYYFGHHPANRLELSRGRDLVVDPAPVSGPINFLAYPVLEIDGLPAKVAERSFTFRRLGDAATKDDTASCD